jgi:hypothetical protein
VAPHTWLASIRADDTLRWSAAYQSRPDVDDNGEFTDFLGLSPVGGDGLVLCGRIGFFPDKDAFAIRVDAEGMRSGPRATCGSSARTSTACCTSPRTPG